MSAERSEALIGQELFEILEQLILGNGGVKLPEPVTDILKVEIIVSAENPFDIFDIDGPASEDLMDDEILWRSKPHVNIPEANRPSPGNRQTFVIR